MKKTVMLLNNPDPLFPPMGKEHLGLTLSFVRNLGKENEGENIYDAFIQGAAKAGYKILVVNNTKYNRQPQIKPQSTSIHPNVHNFYIPWLALPLDNQDKPLSALANLIPEYDFTIIGTGGAESQGTNGLLDLELTDPPHFFDIKSIIDRFVFDARQEIPEELVDRSVTYSDMISLTRLHKVAPMIPLMLDKPDESLVKVLLFNTDGKFYSSQENGVKYYTRNYATKKPVIANLEHSVNMDSSAYYQLVFTTIVGLVKSDTLYIDEEFYQQKMKSLRARGIVSLTSGLVPYLAVNGAVTVSVFEQPINAVLFIITGIIGAFPAVGLAYSGERLARRADKGINLLPSESSSGYNLISKASPILLLEATEGTEKTQDGLDNSGSPQGIQHNIQPVSIRTVRKMHEQSIKRYNDIHDRWLAYELDITKFISAPLMRDLSCAETAQFFTAMHRSQSLLDALSGTDDEDAIELMQSFEQSVAEMTVAFEHAEAKAVQTGPDYLPAAKKKDFDTAAQMMSVADDDAASITERANAFTQGKKLLSKAVITPPTVYGEIEGRIKAIESMKACEQAA